MPTLLTLLLAWFWLGVVVAGAFVLLVRGARRIEESARAGASPATTDTATTGTAGTDTTTAGTAGMAGTTTTADRATAVTAPTGPAVPAPRAGLEDRSSATV